MKPTALKPSDAVICDNRRMTFIRRDKARCGQPAANWFHCPAYVGLDGPADDGRCYMSDQRVITHVTKEAK